MNVGPSHFNNALSFQTAKPLHSQSKTGPAEKVGPGLVSPETLEAVDPAEPAGEPQPVSDATTPKEHGPGVLRLLEAGHFKGVADVRLRINFFDELNAGASAGAATAAAEGVVQLADTVDEAVEELFAGFTEDEVLAGSIRDLLAEFDAAALAATDSTASGTSFDADALAQAIQVAFDALVGGIENVLTGESGANEQPPPPDSGDVVDPSGGDTTAPSAGPIDTAPTVADSSVATAEETAPVEGQADDATATALHDALTALATIFDEALMQLQDAVSAASQPSDPSPPSGNGAAFEKFLAIYDALRGGSSTVDRQA